jgi:C1A family cysteine protease
MCQEESNESVTNTILNKFMDKSLKELFKVWHLVFNKEYDYNTEEGLKKYKTFKANLKKIKEVNASKQSYQLGLNQYSDLTFQEFANLYGLKEIKVDELNEIKSTIEEFNNAKRFDLDSFKDDDEDDNSTNKKVGVTSYDWRPYSLAIRDQGKICGSCWAFSTMAQIENSYWMKYGKTTGAVNQYLSPQQLVDCNTTNYGCGGGWPSYAMKYLQTSYPIPDSKYPYTAVNGSCKYNVANSVPIKITGIRYGGTYYSSTISTYSLLANGPAVVLVGVNDTFRQYTSGIFSGTCLNYINHAVALVGYGYDTTTGKNYYIIRNSWGVTFGEKGYMRILDDGVACFLPMYSYQAIIG